MDGDHPRTCGENLKVSDLMEILKGSPPHLRGKLLVTYLRFFPLGITPAPAGKTNLLRLYSSVSRDHPRTCGENILNPKEKPREIGSPPHLRGKRHFVSCFALGSGITPAPAGKTKGTENKNSTVKDHPRTCGENLNKSALMYWREGSPPHLRGKPWCVSIHLPHFRITPAPAGKTDTCISFNKACEDHPRTCGENLDISVTRHLHEGSPPHLRGKHFRFGNG